MNRSQKLRTFFVRYIAMRAGLRGSAVEEAFATVPREPFLGPAPWYLLVPPRPGTMKKLGYLPTPDDDPAFVYHDGLIALDHERGIHNGAPTLHAVCINGLGIEAGQRILHVGAGTGYYSAILAHLTGPDGLVSAYEIDPALAERARETLALYSGVSVAGVSGTLDDLPDADAIYVSAGSTQPAPAWLRALRPAGNLLFPLQPKGGFGGMLLVEKPAPGEAWAARFVCRAGFIACDDLAQDVGMGDRLKAAFDGSNGGGKFLMQIDTLIPNCSLELARFIIELQRNSISSAARMLSCVIRSPPLSSVIVKFSASLPSPRSSRPSPMSRSTRRLRCNE